MTIFTDSVPLGRLLSCIAWASLLVSLPGCSFTPMGHVPSAGVVAASEAQGCELLPDLNRSTLVIFEPSVGRKLTCNEPRSRERFVPASTYKIPHSLIALETGVVESEHRKFEWDGRPRGVAAWDDDLSLAEAVPVSAVWVFQTVADRVGQNRESEWVNKLEYGNQDVGSRTDLRHFWLAGPLKISAQEQVDFLMRMRSGAIPASSDAIARTIALLDISEAEDGSIVYGKTGAMLPIDDEGVLRLDRADLLPANAERTGWFVGWINRSEGDGGPVYFALNLDLELPDAMNARTKVAYEVLAANGYPVPKPQP
ncbi:penicillin-binding transpeptidase domain-containing protein [Halomonas sp. SpR8]|uniref:penicillin-binding transpeptidase domain-containing protein n=1 Tax=Halomonas sp. SpR8 TaxID=3050463 RepID=UPI0027E44B9A|nr:penicillin-binding transpeptidase domain-containing protein [Halomonas sp. SpR8]MDQ7727178.1 penicillin-binding transpeptidase domain-containing protein [Halomonas sp. SpR8]